MKIGIIGDIHSNLEALQTVLDILDEEGCDEIFCTGDIIGYGPAPVECMEIVRRRQMTCVLGNHDHYVTLLLDPRLERLAPDIRDVIKWTQSLLSMDDLKWLARLPPSREVDGIGLVHGSYGPRPSAYLTKEKNVRRNFEHQPVPLAFGGHTHIPMIATWNVSEEAPAMYYLRSTDLPQADKIMINVGSVGQPRDHDPRAACGIFDVEKQYVKSFRIPYDIEATQQQMRKLDLPERFIVRLEEGM